MRQAGRYLPEYMKVRQKAGDFLSLCYSPELAVEVTLQPVNRFGLDAAILFSDILVVPDALGQNVRFEEGEGPLLDPLRSVDQISRLNSEGMAARLDPVYRTVERVAEALPNTVALIGFAGAPWTVATYMVEGGGSREFAHVKSWAFSDPGSFQELIDILVNATTEHLLAQVDAGADVLQLFDTWAGVLPEDEFAKWCIAPARQIVSRIHDVHPNLPVIGFPRGVGLQYVRYIIESGVDGVSIDSSVPLEWAVEELQSRCAVQGNLDPVMLLAGGDAMIAATRKIVSALGSQPFVFNLGHGVIRDTPPDHVSALVEAVRGT